MNKLKKLTLIFVLVTLIMAIFSILTFKGFFIFGGIASFSLSVFYLYLNRARQTFKKDLLESMK